MSINIGIYDLFSNTIPGFLYFYVVNELFRLFELPYVDINKLESLAHILILATISFVLGHLFNAFTYRWYRIFVKTNHQSATLSQLKSLHPELEIGFKSSDIKLLFGVIKNRNLPLAQVIESFRATAIMLRNISLGLVLLSVLQIVSMIKIGFSVSLLSSCFIALILSAMALRRGSKYDKWFYRDTYIEALNYGTNLVEILLPLDSESSDKEGKMKIDSPKND